MDVDFVITELEVGGAEGALVQLALGMQSHGDDVRVFALGGSPARLHLLDQLTAAGIDVRFGEAERWTHLAALHRRLRRWLARRPAALCQSFLFHANVLVAATAPVRVKPSRVKRVREKPGRVKVAGLRVAEPRAGRVWLERRALRRFDHAICVSSAVQRLAVDRLGVPAARSSVIGNAVDESRFAGATPFDWRRLGWSADACVTLFVGRFEAQKNLAALRRTLPRWAPEGSNRKLVLVGDGPQRPALQAWAASTSGDRVRVLPWQPDVAPLMAACRVLILPSRYEGMPNVVLEAMAAGKPVLCSRVEGSEELIGHDDRQGFGFDHDDQMLARLEGFLSDAALAERVGQENRSRVVAEFSPAAMVAAYRRTYQALLDDRS